MAITCITGVPRSGKSYYAVYLLYRTFVHVEKETAFSKFTNRFVQRKLDKKYDFAYTNINQFNFERSPQIKLFVYEEIYAILSVLHGMHLDKKPDDELIELAIQHEVYNAVFVIDECQNYFDKDEKILTWWFTYHGHLHQDIILITQNFDLIYQGYTKLGEFFYKAVPPSSRIFSSKFRYIQYNSYKCFSKDKIGDFNVPIDKNVFDMYVSGASNAAPSQVKKYLVYALVLFCVLCILFYWFMELLAPTPPPKPQQKQIQRDLNATTFKQLKTNNEENKTRLFAVNCIDGLCRLDGFDFPRPLLTKIIIETKPKFVNVKEKGSLKTFYILTDYRAFDFLTNNALEDEKQSRKDKNEKVLSTPSSVAGLHK